MLLFDGAMEQKYRFAIIPKLSPRSRSISLRLDARSGDFILRHGPMAKPHQINEFVNNHLAWMDKVRGEWERHLGEPGGPWLPLKGKAYKTQTSKIIRPILDEEKATIFLPQVTPGKALARFLRGMAKEQLGLAVENYQPLIGARPTGLRITDTKSRWGSCSGRGIISLSFRLIMLPEDLRDYVVVHELCHLHEMNHGPAFWGHVARQVPDYRNKRKLIRARTNKIMSVTLDDHHVARLSHQTTDAKTRQDHLLPF
jgi:predicted metal-dependent hydrolase